MQQRFEVQQQKQGYPSTRGRLRGSINAINLCQKPIFL